MTKEFLPGAAKVQESVIPAKAGIRVPLTDLTEKTWIPVCTGMTKCLGEFLADSLNSALESRELIPANDNS
jgi:hypothetical protein